MKYQHLLEKLNFDRGDVNNCIISIFPYCKIHNGTFIEDQQIQSNSFLIE